MKNKKGISIGRILLYVLFLSLIALFIWTLYVTFKTMKKKDHVDLKSSYSYYSYNNNFDYSGADYISDSYLNFYKTTSIVHSVYDGNVNYDLTSISTNFTSSTLTTYCKPVNNGGTPGYVPYVYNAKNYVSDNVLNFSSLLDNFYNAAATTIYPPSDNWFTLSLNGIMTKNNSACIIINFDNLPIELLDFTFSGLSFDSNPWIFVKGNGSSSVYSIRGAINGHVTYDSLPNELKSNSSYITTLAIPVWQQIASNNDANYLPSHNYNYTETLQHFSCEFSFTIFTQDNSFQEGYESGYSQGILNADNALRSMVDELSASNSSLNASIDSLRSQIEQQQIIINDLNTQLQAQSNNFKGLFFTMADIPFRTVSNALGFEFWGVNLFRFFVGIITALGILWLIKRLYK